MYNQDQFSKEYEELRASLHRGEIQEYEDANAVAWLALVGMFLFSGAVAGILHLFGTDFDHVARFLVGG